MKKIVKMVKILLLITFLSISGIYSNRVLAKTSISTKASSNVKAIKVGDEIALTFAINDLQEVGEGVNAYILTLNFNNKEFEFVKAEGQNGWNSPVYNKISLTTGKIKLVSTRQEFMDETGDVLKIVLKSKQNYPASDSTNISLEDISFAAKIDDKTTKIPITEKLELKLEDEDVEEETPVEEEEYDDEDDVFIDNDEDEDISEDEDSEEEPPVLSDAGKNMIGGVAILIAFLCAIIFYYKYKKINKYIK